MLRSKDAEYTENLYDLVYAMDILIRTAGKEGLLAIEIYKGRLKEKDAWLSELSETAKKDKNCLRKNTARAGTEKRQQYRQQ